LICPDFKGNAVVILDPLSWNYNSDTGFMEHKPVSFITQERKTVLVEGCVLAFENGTTFYTETFDTPLYLWYADDQINITPRYKIS
jgi:hypothetical protein